MVHHRAAGKRAPPPPLLLLFVLLLPGYLLATVIVEEGITASDEGTASPLQDSVNHKNLVDPPTPPTALLVALEDGEAGVEALREWSAYAGKWSNILPPVWVLCSNHAIENLVRDMPNVLTFFADNNKSWGVVLAERFLLQKANIFGFFGEGSLPHPRLAESITSLQAVSALGPGTPPTVIVSRSRLRGGGRGGGTADGRHLLSTGGEEANLNGDYLLRGGGDGGSKTEGEWLSDKFVGQMWCNRSVLTPSRLTKAGLYQRAVKDAPFLEAIGSIIEASAHGEDVLLVDGSHAVRSTFASSKQDDGRADSPVEKRELSKGFRIGRANFALGYTGYRAEGGAKEFRIEQAPWPPRYVLETVASGRKTGGGESKGSNGLVIVSSANCGRLDRATNFLMSVRRTSGAKVLHVVTDEVAFDFMEQMAPGCTALIPAELSMQLASLRASTATAPGNPAFAAENLLRSFSLELIVNQGYEVLWSDSDMVWIRNPLPLLPDVDDPLAAEVMMIQQDEGDDNDATSFLFLRPTFFAKTLLKWWGEKLLTSQEGEDKMPFRESLQKLEAVGLQSTFTPKNASPRFKDFSNKAHVENYAHVMKPEAIMVHNDWNAGTDAIERLEMYHIWDVGYLSFPKCA